MWRNSPKWCLCEEAYLQLLTFNVIQPNLMRRLITQKLAHTILLLWKNISQAAMFILEFIECSFPLRPWCLWKGLMYLFLTSHTPFQSHFMESLPALVFTQGCFQAICPSIVPLQSNCSSRLVTFDLVISQIFLCKTFGKRYSLYQINNRKVGLSSTFKLVSTDDSLNDTILEMLKLYRFCEQQFWPTSEQKTCLFYLVN